MITWGVSNPFKAAIIVIVVAIVPIQAREFAL